jgi:hypothetical protein
MLWKIGEDLKTKKFQSLISNWSSLTSIQEISSTSLLINKNNSIENKNTSITTKTSSTYISTSTGDKKSSPNVNSANGSSSQNNKNNNTKSLFVMNRATTQLLQKISTFSK